MKTGENRNECENPDLIETKNNNIFSPQIFDFSFFELLFSNAR